jgi:GTP-binding nuclear protein Ran
MSTNTSSSSSPGSLPTFKVSLIGPARVGKTTFIKRWRTGEFETKYLPTIGVEVFPLTFNTDKGRIRLNVWDCAGDPKRAGLEDGYWLQSHAAFLMFDLAHSESFEVMKQRLEDVNRLLGHTNPAIVVCGNKADCGQREVNQSSILSWMKGKDLTYYDISAKNHYNFETPWLYLLRKLTGDSALIFVAEEPVLPPECSYDSENAE